MCARNSKWLFSIGERGLMVFKVSENQNIFIFLLNMIYCRFTLPSGATPENITSALSKVVYKNHEEKKLLA